MWITAVSARCPVELIVCRLLIALQYVGADDYEFTLISAASAAGDTVINRERFVYAALLLRFKGFFRFGVDTLSKLLHGFCIAGRANTVMVLFKSKDGIYTAKSHHVFQLGFFI